MRMSVSLDVPSLAAGLAFYGSALGFVEQSRPLPTMAYIRSGEAAMLLIEKPEGSFPHPDPAQPRSYRRHWTPVHLDFHVSDAMAARQDAEAAGARCDAWHDVPGRSKVAFMADPFGHGFCLIEARG